MTQPKSPKQILLEFYAQYPDATKPTFQCEDIPGARPSDPLQYRCSVVCPAVRRATGDLAYEDLMFEGVGKSKKAAEHDAADKAYTYIRTLPGLKLPSGGLTLGVHTAGLPQTATAFGAAGAAAGGATPMVLAPAPAGPGVAAPAGAYDPSAAAGAFPQLGLTINEAMVDSMTPEQLKMALREVLGLYKSLVQAVHAESQRHAAELQTIIMRQL